MENRYRLILSNNKFYREVQLPSSATQFRVGTTYESDCRFAKERFFTGFELLFQNDGNTWIVNCRKGDIFFQDKGAMKLKSYKLSHGAELRVLFPYQGKDQLLFKLSFILDFEAEKANYERVLDVGGYQFLTFGRDRKCDVVLDDPLLEHDTVKLERRGNDLFIVDCGTRYGVYVNGVKIQGEEQIRDYDFFSILGFSFYYKEGDLYTSRYTKLFPQEVPAREISDQNNHLSYPQFNRNTQVKINIPEEEISVLDPPAKPEKPKQNIIMTLLPSLAMIALVVVMRGVMGGGNMSFVLYSAASMCLGVVTTIIGFINGNKEFKETTAKREEEYNEYLAEKRGEVRNARQLEKELLQKRYISPEEEKQNVETFDRSLFDRTPKDEDFLTLRLGTGSLEAHRKVTCKSKDEISVSDPLAKQPKIIQEEFRNIDGVPIRLPLAQLNAINVTGNDGEIYEFIKQSIIDLCTRQYYDEMRLFLISERPLDEFSWARWLPHFDNPQIGGRNIASTSEERTVLLEYLYSELVHRSQTKTKSPQLVIFVYFYTAFKNHPISKFIDAASSLGVTFIFVENYPELTPQYCSWLIQLNSKGEGELIDSSGEKGYFPFSFRSLEDRDAEALAVKLAPVFCEEISLEAALTKNISFYEMMGIFTVDDLDLGQKWASAQIYKTMAAPVGVKTGDKLVYLDLHEKAHGPHGLVAGTTGSGKSEALQTYILSMAITYHPYEVGFVIIDFKGGGMADQFKDLPHLVGTITNIDGREINRSLKSIKAELQKRQRVFRDAQVNNIGDYIKKYKAGQVSLPLPHLIIVVDEFAELKAEQPDFMAELISAARIGRSLGVHLILATQKPSGQVNEQIWSNSRFKLCLKVQDAQDSNEVLKSPLAAEIKEPGRAYLQVGNNEIFELFQSAYSGAPAVVSDTGTQKEYDISVVSLPGKRKPVYQQRKKRAESGPDSQNQLQAVVECVQKYCKENQITHLPPICLPSLKEIIPYQKQQTIDPIQTTVVIGIYDDPDRQYQGSTNLNLSSGNTVIVGSSQMGKTNILQTIIKAAAENYSPDEVTMYIIDFNSMILKNFSNMVHVGGVVTVSEDEALKNLFKILLSEITKRKEKLVDAGVSSFISYREAGMRDLPQILLFIDNLTALKELYLQDNDVLIGICRDGPAVGISLIVTNSQTSGIGYRYLSSFANRIALFCNDSGEYSSVFDHSFLRPANVNGRCIIEIEKNQYECQTFLAFEGQKEIDRVESMRSFVKQINERYGGQSTAVEIPVIPKVLTQEILADRFPQTLKPYHVIVGLDYASVSPVVFDMTQLGLLAISGKKNMGRSNFIRHLLFSLEQNRKYAPVSVCIADNMDQKFSGLQKLEIVSEYTLSSGKVIETIEKWDQELKNRYDKLTSGDIAYIQEAPLLLLIIHNTDIATEISNNRECLAQYKNFFAKYKAMKVSVIYSNFENTNIPYGAPEAIKPFRDNRHFLFFDDLARMKLMDVPISVMKQYKKPIEVGDCYLSSETGIAKMKTVLCEKE